MARKSEYLVCRDHNGRTCLKLAESQGLVQYIPMAELNFEVETTSTDSFNQRYKPMPKYPVDKACQLFLNYATILGASDEVLDYLSTEVTVTNEDRAMATSKYSNPPPTEMVGKKKPTKKAPAKKTAPKAKATPAKKAPTKKRAVKAAPTGDYTSAAKMFQGLIMEGKLTDDEIFAAVQEQFGLDDKKRSYVGWYRNKLHKDGENPPEAV